MRYGASDAAIYYYNLQKFREHRRHALDAAARIDKDVFRGHGYAFYERVINEGAL